MKTLAYDQSWQSLTLSRGGLFALAGNLPTQVHQRLNPDKTVNLTLSNPTTSVAEGPYSGFSLGTPNPATLNILNDATLKAQVASPIDPTLTVPLDGGCGCGGNFPDLALRTPPAPASSQSSKPWWPPTPAERCRPSSASR